MGWRGFVSPELCLELGALTCGYSCVPATCPDVPWQMPACWPARRRVAGDRGSGPGSVVCLSLALCNQGRARWGRGCRASPLGLPLQRVLAPAGRGPWHLAAFWLSKGGREGCVYGLEGNGVIGAGWHLGAGPGQGLPGVLISALWAGRCSARPLSVQLSLLLWSLHLLPGADSSTLQRRERLAGVARAIWSPGCSSHRPGTLAGERRCVAGQQRRAGKGRKQ